MQKKGRNYFLFETVKNADSSNIHFLKFKEDSLLIKKNKRP